jgi:ubiquinone/menaquinone biosynthesis C-methylase UbiE
MSNINYTYKEYSNALNSRIDIHKKYSNFNLHEWVKKNIKIDPGQSILDMGCGNGNFINFFLLNNPDLKITGVDTNNDLLNEIKNTTNNKSLKLIHNDYDNFELKNQKFDWIFFIYSIYYSQKPKELIKKMYSYLKNNGQLVIIGPGKSNAIELDKLNKKITGLDPKPEYRERQKRIEEEFYELSKEIFGKSNCDLNILNNKLSFPNEIEYAEYYWSTLLWRDSLERLNNPNEKKLKEKSLIEIKNSKNFVINKQVSTLIVKK